MLDDAPGGVAESGRDPFANVAPLLGSVDFRVANLESVIATTGSPMPDKPFTFRAHPRVIPFLKRHFDAVGLSNNHAGDFGTAAFTETLRLLDANGLRHFGGGIDLTTAHQPLIVERKGLRVALLAYNEFLPRSFEADFDKPGIAWSEDEHVKRDIQHARTRFNADLVIPFMHWGQEDVPSADRRQRQLARLMIDAGADAVVGGHPHVTQDIEHYAGKPIFYSLGNFVFDGFETEAGNTGWLLRMELDRSGVRRWRIDTVHLDMDGLPWPSRTVAGICWERQRPGIRACPV